MIIALTPVVKLSVLTLLCLSFFSGALSQVSSEGAMDGASLLRTGVYPKKGLPSISAVDWRTNKFFSINYSNNAFTNSDGDLELASLGFSDPIVAGNILCYRLYPSPRNNLIVAMDTSGGNVLWTFKSKEQLSNPVIAGENVYFVSEDRHVYELNAKTGVQNWKVELKGKKWSAFSGSPVLNADRLYASTAEGHLVVVDTKTRQTKWIFQAKGLLSPIALANSTAVFGDAKGSVFAVDADGKQVWIFKAPGQVRTLTGHENSFYFRTDNGVLHAVDAKTGTVRWATKLGGSYQPVFPVGSVQVGSSLAVFRGIITFAGREKGNDHIFGVSAADGKELWRLKIDAPTRNPVVADGIAYYGGLGKLLAVDIVNGQLRWEIPYQSKVDGSSVTNAVSSPAVSDGRLHVISDEGVVYAYK